MKPAQIDLWAEAGPQATQEAPVEVSPPGLAWHLDCRAEDLVPDPGDQPHPTLGRVPEDAEALAPWLAALALRRAWARSRRTRSYYRRRKPGHVFVPPIDRWYFPGHPFALEALSEGAAAAIRGERRCGGPDRYRLRAERDPREELQGKGWDEAFGWAQDADHPLAPSIRAAVAVREVEGILAGRLFGLVPGYGNEVWRSHEVDGSTHWGTWEWLGRRGPAPLVLAQQNAAYYLDGLLTAIERGGEEDRRPVLLARLAPMRTAEKREALTRYVRALAGAVTSLTPHYLPGCWRDHNDQLRRDLHVQVEVRARDAEKEPGKWGPLSARVTLFPHGTYKDPVHRWTERELVEAFGARLGILLTEQQTLL